MRWSKINLCYYPTTVTLVDDQKTFLDEFKAYFNGSILCKFYNDPKEVVNFFSQYQPRYFLENCISFDEDNQSDDRILPDIELRHIYKEIYNPNRFAQISQLIADYAMPSVNGLECCKAVKDHYIKKILLTGEAGIETVIDAFNKQIIDRYIKKSTPALMNVVSQNILEMQMQYFSDLSENIYNAALMQFVSLHSLNDPAFVNFFYDLCEKHSIVEYYLLDGQGSFLMLDVLAKPYWLLVKTEKEMKGLFEFAEFENASPSIVDALRSRSKFPYFHTEDDLQTPLGKWESYMHTASKIDGKQSYYYALVNDPKAFGFDSTKVLSYQKYWENLGLR